MARGGINKALVQKARQAIQGRGENPSIDAIRVELGNTGSKTTIHRYLKELEDTQRGGTAPLLSLSEQLANLVGQLADQLNEEANATVALEREQLTRERLEYEIQAREYEGRIKQFEGQCAGLTGQLQATEQAFQQELKQRQHTELENTRLIQAHHDQQVRLQDRDGQILSLEDKHQHARDALEHYRQASKEQREQEQRRHESQAQQLQLELRQLQQTLMVKHDDLTQLNRDNARLITEARQLKKDQYTQQQLLARRTEALEVAKNTLSASELANETMEQRCHALQQEVTRLSEASLLQTLQAQSLLERLAETTAHLKLLGYEQPLNNGN